MSRADHVTTHPRVYTCFLVLTIVTRILSLTDDSQHECRRPCEVSEPKRCNYTFVLRYKNTMSVHCGDCPFNQSACFDPNCVLGDGQSRGVITVNGRIGGPMIEVCEGDHVDVTVVNKLMTLEGTTIHWHGMRQVGTPFMDGVSIVTQCLISPATSFKYSFQALDSGTHFWHGHNGLQRSDGLFGPLIVRTSRDRDPQRSLYDLDLSEHVITLIDWFSDLALVYYLHYIRWFEDRGDTSVLINGRGQGKVFRDKRGNKYVIPRQIFKVESGKRYRFRFINAGVLNCFFQISVENHVMLVIASDGQPLQPFLVHTVDIYPGERFDVVIMTSYRLPARNHRITVKAMGACNDVSHHAILKYDGAPDLDPRLPDLSHVREPVSDVGDILKAQVNQFNRMAAIQDDVDGILTSKPDVKQYFSLNIFAVNVNKFVSKERSQVDMPIASQNRQLNKIQFTLPSSPPLTQWNDIDESTICNATTLQGQDCAHQLCACVHVVSVATGQLVEMVFVNEGMGELTGVHPVHLHGYSFRVVAMGLINSNATVYDVEAMDNAGEITRRTKFAPLKDTVIVPPSGYTIVRFKADNPGVWMLHCHFEFHVVEGMALLLKVGQPEEWARAPEGFPKCGHWNIQ